eukprot:10806537-Prorocentrum_lima.AAC.1
MLCSQKEGRNLGPDRSDQPQGTKRSVAEWAQARLGCFKLVQLQKKQGLELAFWATNMLSGC